MKHSNARCTLLSFSGRCLGLVSDLRLALPRAGCRRGGGELAGEKTRDLRLLLLFFSFIPFLPTHRKSRVFQVRDHGLGSAPGHTLLFGGGSAGGRGAIVKLPDLANELLLARVE